MTEKLRVREVLVVEGKYDAARLQNLVDGLVLCTGGFNVFTSEETKELILRMGRARPVCADRFRRSRLSHPALPQ